MRRRLLYSISSILALAMSVFFWGSQAVSVEEFLPGKIVFHTYRDPKTWDIAVLANGEIKIIDKVAHGPRWSRDGKKMLYVSQVDKDFKLIVVDYETGEEKTFKPSPAPFHPVWFTATEILFVGTDFGDKKDLKDNTDSLYVFDTQAGTIKKLYEFKPGQHVSKLDVSADRKVSIISADGLYVSSFKDHYVMQFNRIGFAHDARFSPDGRQIVFSTRYDQRSQEINKHDQIFVMDLETKQITQLTNNEWDNIDPCWSPGGKQILFVSGRYASSHTMGSELFVMDADGKNERRVTKAVRLGQMIGVGPLWSRDQNPDWAP